MALIWPACILICVDSILEHIPTEGIMENHAELMEKQVGQ